MTPPEALRLLRVSKRDLAMARRLLDPAVEEASWGWAMQQCIEKILKAWLSTLGLPVPRSHDIARLLLLLESAGMDVGELLPWRAFTVYAVQFRYDDEPDVLGLDRELWCNQAQRLIEQIEQLNH
ncbi:MAG: HEPN domain-containing protein [Cyanobium sp.]